MTSEQCVPPLKRQGARWPRGCQGEAQRPKAFYALHQPHKDQKTFDTHKTIPEYLYKVKPYADCRNYSVQYTPDYRTTGIGRNSYGKLQYESCKVLECTSFSDLHST